MTEEELETQRRLDLLKDDLKKSLEPLSRRLTTSQINLIHANGSLCGSLGNGKITLAAMALVFFITGSIVAGGILTVLAGLMHYFEKRAFKRFESYREEFQKQE